MQNPILSIFLENITLSINGKSQNSPINLADITAIFSHMPPSEMAWEKAIYLIEESISPLKSQLVAFKSLAVTGEISQDLRLLPCEIDEATGEKFISANTVELAFAVLAGYRPLKDLGEDLPYYLLEDKAFYAMILLLREWVHHLDFERIYLV